MLGLGAYDSSSEEEIETKELHDSKKKMERLPAAAATDLGNGEECIKQVQQPPATTPTSELPTGPVLGPVSGPASNNPELSPDDLSKDRRSSPYSASRALVQDLTLPPFPNLDIPPSPPGSPDPAANAKFEHFLALKKQGVHFNSKLASSSSLKNPSLLMKMMNHAGIDEQSQYNTSLPEQLWSTSNLPSWGYKEELLRTQQQTRQKLEELRASGQRSSVEFVSGSTANNSSSDLEMKGKGHH